MPRGGARPNSGPQPHWKHGKTKTIRVPIVLADRLLELARELDEVGENEFDTSSIKKQEAEKYAKEIAMRVEPAKRKLVSRYLNELVRKVSVLF